MHAAQSLLCNAAPYAGMKLSATGGLGGPLLPQPLKEKNSCYLQYSGYMFVSL